MPELTICSACYGGARYLNLNYELTTSVTNCISEWIVVQNSPEQLIKDLDDTDLRSEFRVLPEIQMNPDVSEPNKQHGLSLNETIKNIKKSTRYVLLLDQDFFIVPPLDKILDMMDSRNLTFFGAPYAKSRASLLHDFPVAFCLFIDTEQVDIKELNFLPHARLRREKLRKDVGYDVYRKYKDEYEIYDFALPSVIDGAKFKHVKYSISSRYDLDYDRQRNRNGTEVDEYFHEDRPFGIHLRTKFHQKINHNRKRIQKHLKNTECLMPRLRNLYAKANR